MPIAIALRMSSSKGARYDELLDIVVLQSCFLQEDIDARAHRGFGKLDLIHVLARNHHILRGSALPLPNKNEFDSVICAAHPWVAIRLHGTIRANNADPPQHSYAIKDS